MALANDIALYALGYWSHEQHPVRINSLCLNTIQRKTPCSACTDICPEHIVLHAGKANWNGCTNCNLCVNACPTAAINQSSTGFSGIRQTILEGSAPISFACDRCEEASDVRCVCLAAVPWDLLAAAALGCGVVVKADACKSCPHEGFVARVKETIRTLKGFLGKERFGSSVFLHDQPDQLRSAGTDRRLAFNRFADSVAQGAEVALGAHEKPTMSCNRALLLEVIETLADQDSAPVLRWQTLIEDGNCRGCEICTKLCPHKALELWVPGYSDASEEDDDEASGPSPLEPERKPVHEDGQFLIHNASKCTQCGLCYVSCPQENLGGWDVLETASHPAYKAWPIDVKLCEDCGRPFKPANEGQTSCTACKRPGFSPSRQR